MDVLIALLAVVGAFYFILLRPVINQQRRRRRDISSLAVGDEVLTGAGFYATVREIRTSDDGPLEILLEVAPGVTLRATADSIEQITRHEAAEEPATESASESDSESESEPEPGAGV